METNIKELKLFSISEAARVLCIGRDTLKKIIAAGDIGFIKIGKCRKIPYQELLRFVNENISWKTPDENKSLSDKELTEFFGHPFKTSSLNGEDILQHILRKKSNGNNNKKGEDPSPSMV